MRNILKIILLLIIPIFFFAQSLFALSPESQVEGLGKVSKDLGDLASRNRGSLGTLEECLSKLITHPGRRILDLGCGEGSAASVFKDDPDALVVGIDIGKERIKKAKRQYPRDKYPNMYFFCIDAKDLPFPPDSFDLITIYYPNPMYEDQEPFISGRFYSTFLQGAVRLARNGATIMVESENQETQRIVYRAMSNIGNRKVDPPFLPRRGEYTIRTLEVVVTKQGTQPHAIPLYGETLIPSSV